MGRAAIGAAAAATHEESHQIREIKRSETIPGNKRKGTPSLILSVLGSLLCSWSLKLLLRLGVVVPVAVEVVPPRAEPVGDEPEGAGVSALAADGLVVVAPVGGAALHADAEALAEIILKWRAEMGASAWKLDK